MMKNYLISETRKMGCISFVLLAAAGVLGSACAPKGKAALPYDLLFIDAMIAHHQGAIAMSQPVIARALHPELKDFARKVVEDQSREVAQMTQWRDQWFPGRPKTPNILDMPGMAKSMMDISPDHMQKLTGAAFDQMFLDMMIFHHQGAVTMAKDALAKSQHPEIRTLAQQIIDAQQREIETMNGWKSEWAKAR
jgi:uncharacterized protein (DUF305 family)